MSTPCETRVFQAGATVGQVYGRRDFSITGWTGSGWPGSGADFVAFDVEFDDRALFANLTPRLARSIAIGLLEAADEAEGLDE